MRIVLASLAFLFSALLFAWDAAIFLYPIYILGWEDGSQLWREWPDWGGAAAVGATATVLLIMGLAVLMSRPNHPTNT
jgi:uncharacterized membrane protein